MIYKHSPMFSPTVCNALVEGILENVEPHEVDKTFRKSELRWIRKGDPVSNSLINCFIHFANKVRHKHNITRVLDAESIQFTTYHENGEYKMHCDNGGRPSLITRHRQLSMVMQLNDPADFMGGGLEFKDEDADLDLQQGDIVTFNSGLYHRAKPVKVGVRHVMVCWFFPVDCAYYEEKENGIMVDAHHQNQGALKAVLDALRNNV